MSQGKSIQIFGIEVVDEKVGKTEVVGLVDSDETVVGVGAAVDGASVDEVEGVVGAIVDGAVVDGITVDGTEGLGTGIVGVKVEGDLTDVVGDNVVIVDNA